MHRGVKDMHWVDLRYFIQLDFIHLWALAVVCLWYVGCARISQTNIKLRVLHK